MPSVAAILHSVKTFVRQRRIFVALVVAFWVGLAAYPYLGGFVGKRVVTARLAERTGVAVTAQQGRARAGRLELQGFVIGGGTSVDSILTAEMVEIPFEALWGGGTILFRRPTIHIAHGGAGDNVSGLLERLAHGQPGGGSGGQEKRSWPQIVFTGGTLEASDAARDLSLSIDSFDAIVAPGLRAGLNARKISGTLGVWARKGENDPAFGAAAIEIEIALAGLRPATPFAPKIHIHEGYLQVLPTLPLSGINGSIEPPADVATATRADLAIDLSGSWAGARKALWTARGELGRGGGGKDRQGHLAIKAERFTLDKIAEVLPASVLSPKNTSVDAELTLALAGGKVDFEGNMDVAHLAIRHDALGPDLVDGLNLGLRLNGQVDPARRRLELVDLEAKLRNLVTHLRGSIELAPGTFKHTDGTLLPAVPKIDLELQVPRIPCAKLLDSIPASLVARLQGFELQGIFEASIKTKIDFANLDALELGGKVGIDGCHVIAAPEEVSMLGGTDSVIRVVEVPAAPPADGTEMEMMAVAIGPESPDFVPYEKISRHVVNAIMTTEDSGFFKHHGWVSSEFKTALRRNLAGGGFRLGASSITMQMVKNVLLSREKTLSRKLQELFLVWYIEQKLPKEKILELYFNAIEFGPRTYGIGPAAHHYFGKNAADLSPTEAAFFSSILPSPKRRYIQYCHGELYPPWEKYLKRIVARMYERGRLTAEEYALASVGKLVFDVTAREGTEKQCLDWVKRMSAQKPEPDPPPELEAP